MNRPRNRQPRSGFNSTQGRGGGRAPGHRQGPAAAEYRPVPTTRDVKAGSEVSIVLKEDQGTGREVQGFVGELLTRGDHPRGIKVRLRDGRVGRVQRMVNAKQTPYLPMENSQYNLVQDPCEGDAAMHSLADYLPRTRLEDSNQTRSGPETTTSTDVSCPFCDFVGDEIAVSHHVDEHVTS